KNSKAHLLLAISYFNLNRFPKARVEALEAAKLDKNKAALGHLIAARTYWMEKDLPSAKTAFSQFLRDYPTDPGASEAKSFLDALTKAEEGGTAPAAKKVAEVRVEAIPAIERPWAPPDTDEKIPAVAADVACSTDEVVRRISRRSQMALITFER